jgi:hypothetical protein
MQFVPLLIDLLCFDALLFPIHSLLFRSNRSSVLYRSYAGVYFSFDLTTIFAEARLETPAAEAKGGVASGTATGA